jgi:hypothetical protein
MKAPKFAGLYRIPSRDFIVATKAKTSRQNLRSFLRKRWRKVVEPRDDGEESFHGRGRLFS